MKKTVFILIIFLMMQLPVLAKDFILEFVEENYQESESAFSRSPIIYHSIQVKTLGGSKLLVLTGDDDAYRKWIREYIADNKGFIAVVPDTETDRFIGSNVFEMDISNLHPVNLSKYRRDETASRPFTGEEWEQILGDAAPRRKSEIPAKPVTPAPDNPVKKPDAQTPENQAALALKEKAALDAQTLRQEREKELKALGEKRAEEELKQLQEMEKEKERIQKQLADLELQRAKEEEKRKDEMEQRWLAFQKRMLEDESIRKLEQTERYREMRRRWLEQQSGF